MSDDDSPVKKKRRFHNKYKSAWTQEFSFIKPSRKGDIFTFCELCKNDISVSHSGYYDIKRHISTEKHKANSRSVKSTSSLHAFQPSNTKSEKVIQAEVLLQGFITEHNLPITVNDHFSMLCKRMFPDSEIAKSISCGRTKGTHIILQMASDSLIRVRETMVANKRPYSLSTDGKNL